ncbi:MAG: glycosyltransferase, partial [Acidimicrobiia bacterium]|nr:glycosyltransferase [Acidimicrobiia bacterium]
MSAAGERGARADAAPSQPPPSPADAPRVASAVPTIRNPERLGRCLDAARHVATDDGVEIELIVVLDGADPDVAVFLAERAPDATVVSWPERRGLAAGLNAALRATRCSHVAVLQDDAVPQPGWLASLLRTAADSPRAGAVGSLVLSPDGNVQTAGAILGGDGTPAVPWTGEPPPATTFAEVRAVDYVGTASVLVSRAAWSAVGGFDEDFYPAIYVDVDFCTGLWRAGWLVLLDPHSVVSHERFGSTTQRFREFLYQRNRVRFMTKWGSFVAGRPPGAQSASEVEAAIARVARWLEDPPAASSPSGGGPPAEASPIVYVARERDLLRAYVTELESRVAELITESAALSAAHDELHAAHHDLMSTHVGLDSTHEELEAAHRNLVSAHHKLDA